MEQVLFGQRLQNAREAAGMSREQMAGRLGIKTATLEKWEAGKVEPRANRLQMIASLLNVPLLWLIGGSQQVPGTTPPGREVLLQKVIALNSKVNELQLELDELKLMLEAGE